MAWQEIWRATTSSGREVTLEEDNGGGIRVVTAAMDGRLIEIEPEEGQSVHDALMMQGRFTAEEAITIEAEVDRRR